MTFYITVKITPQRVMVILILVALWYCFIGTKDMERLSPSSTESSSSSFSFLSSPFSSSSKDYSLHKMQSLDIHPLSHPQQRILTSSSSTQSAQQTMLPLNSNLSNGEIFHLKYPPIPSVVGIGPEKCGTTSMAYMLTRHPDLIPEVIKTLHEPTGIDSEMRVWLPCGNRNHEESLQHVLRDGLPTKPENYCSLGWYQHFWVPRHDDIRYLHYYLNYMNATDIYTDLLRKQQQQQQQEPSMSGNRKNGNVLMQILDDATREYDAKNPLTWKWKYYYYFEKSPAYWCYEHVAFLFNQLLVPQGTKFFVLMRDPIKRTYSYWSHQTQIAHLRGKWSGYIQSSLQNPQIKKMVELMKDESKTILDIQDELIAAWSDYVYAQDKPYGYIGRRDAVHGKKGKSLRYGRHRLLADVTDERERNLKRRMMDLWQSEQKHPRNFTDVVDENDHEMDMGNRRKLLWTAKDPGYVAADTNPKLGVGASCYVVPLLMWLKYVPVEQLAVMQSELMYGGNHNAFVSDVRCWYSLGYEFDTMEECRNSGKKKVSVSEEHLVGSAKGNIQDSDARQLHDNLFKWCNKRLMELLEIDKYQTMLLHEIRWDAWYS